MGSPDAFFEAAPHQSLTVGRIIEGWNLVVSKVGIVCGEFKKQYDEIAD
jgi:hypothetical protein